MIRSMTGYGKAEGSIADRRYTVEVKTLNHRYLDLSVRLPHHLNFWEPAVRKRVAAFFSRGKVDVTVRAEGENGAGGSGRLGLNLPLLRNYYDLLLQIKGELGLKDEITVAVLAGMRDIFVPVDPLPGTEEIEDMLTRLLDEALAAAERMRESEGESLGQAMIESADQLRDGLAAIKARAPELVRDYEVRLSERIKALTGSVSLDEGRLLQEVAIMAEKSDITEEIKRIESHLGQFYDLVRMKEAAGRKLDFLFQEMGREVNTISAKINDIDTATLIINMKMELAKLREQVQNIE